MNTTNMPFVSSYNKGERSSSQNYYSDIINTLKNKTKLKTPWSLSSIFMMLCDASKLKTRAATQISKQISDLIGHEIKFAFTLYVLFS